MTRTGAGTILSNVRPPYAIGGLAAELAIVEGKTHDGEYQCRLWPVASGLIHEYQNDSSSKQPAPLMVVIKNVEKEKIIEYLELTKVVPYQWVCC